MRTEKMNILCDAIRFEQNECAGFSTLDGGAVVTRAERLILRNGHEAQEFVKQFVLGAEFHFMRSGHWSVP
jgi:hypothetical protein